MYGALPPLAILLVSGFGRRGPSVCRFQSSQFTCSVSKEVPLLLHLEGGLVGLSRDYRTPGA